MSVSNGFRSFALEQLQRTVPGVRARSMFGGVGIYAGDLFFGLMDDDVLYFKVGDSNRGLYETRGMGAFRPAGEGGEVMQYYEVPVDVLEDVEVLGSWVEASVAAAKQAKRGRSRRHRA
jgi:DNA transformation protein and related proteins